MEEEYGLQHGGPLPPAAQRLVAACNDLGLGLLRELLKAGEGRNLLVSPFALSLALAVLYNGAGGDTRRVLRGVLGAHDIGDEEFNAAFMSLRRLLTGGADVTLSLASALWVREGLRFEAPFVQAVGHYYGAEAAALDFDSPTALDAVNQWVREQTAGKIGGVIKSDDISPATDLVLASIAYFKGQWANPFDRASTREAPFHLADGRSRSVPMMHREGSFKFYQTPLFQAVRLPYGDGRLSMD
ncbi:MAG TPA: serpin family protein, partial [Pyrinomonadaceae bacterium]